MSTFSDQIKSRYSSLLPKSFAVPMVRLGPRYGIREVERLQEELVRDRGRAIEERIKERLGQIALARLASESPFGTLRPVRQLARTSPRMVLLAGAGAGKTTALLDLVVNADADVMLVDLADLAMIEGGLPEYLADRARSEFEQDVPPGFFLDALRSGKMMVCFDALDAIADAKARGKMVNRLELWAQEYPLARFVVTSRANVYAPQLNQNLFAHVVLSPWEGAVAADPAQAWRDALDAWTVEGRDAKEVYYTERQRLWQHLALAMLENKVCVVDEAQAIAWLAEAAERDGALKLNKRRAHQAAEALIQGSVPQLTLLDKTEAGFGFASRRLQEALTAQAIVDRAATAGVELTWAVLEPHLWEIAWREPILQAFRALSVEKPAAWAELIGRLLDAGGADALEPTLHRHLLLAAQALVGGAGLDRAAQCRVVDGLVAWLSDAQAAGRHDALNVLFELGNVPAVVERTLALVGDTGLDAWTQQAAAQLLGKVGVARPNEAVAAAQALVENKETSELTRKAALLSLGALLRTLGPADEYRVSMQAQLLAWIQGDELPIDVRGVAVETLGSLMIQSEQTDLLEQFLLWMRASEENKVAFTIQIAAARVLRAMLDQNPDNQPLIEQLIEIVVDDRIDASVRIELAEALGAYGRAADVVSVLKEIALNTKMRYVDQRDAFDALRRLGYATPEVVEACKQVAQSTDRAFKDFVRLAAANALSTLGEPALSMQLVLGLVADKSIYRSTRHDAFRIVGEMGHSGIEALDEAAIAILRIWAKEENTTEDIRERAIESLHILGADEQGYVQDLIAVLQNKREYRRVRQKAAWALGRLSEQWAEPICEGLRTALYDKEETSDVFRTEVSRSLLRYVEEEPAETYLKAVTQESYMAQARHDAAMVLIEYGMAGDAIESLLELVTDINIADNLRETASIALGCCAVGHEEVIQGFQQVLAEATLEPNVRQAAYGALNALAMV
ncbi:MAG: hypothetical protein JW934_13725 [Anaerolineae bacterium]|nr:hypothetical protein [Anaerolineae bacterium]